MIGNYVYANGERIAKFEDAGQSDVDYYLTDHLGSVMAQVDYSGAVKVRNLYRPWGEKLASVVVSGRENRFQYTGQILDEDLSRDLAYYGQRYYDPTLKIFTSPDALWYKDPGTGSYVYCRNNPLSLVDPGGENPLIFWLAVAAASLLTSDYANAPAPGDKTYTKTETQKVAETAGIAAAVISAGYWIQGLLEGAGEAAVPQDGATGRAPNPDGRKGDAAHQQGVSDAAIGAAEEYQGAKVTREGKISTPGGEKESRYGDVVVYDKDGKPIKAYQIGETLKDGKTPVKRERNALKDIENQGVETKFIPKKKD